MSLAEAIVDLAKALPLEGHFTWDVPPNLFPQPLGRNAELADIDANTLMKRSGKKFTVRSHKTAYFEYCDLMKKLAKEALKQDRPYYVEMLLFAAAPKYIVEDIKRRTKVTIKTGPTAPVMQKS